MNTFADQLSFEKTTIRSLTNDEVNDVSGGITPALFAAAEAVVYSSDICVSMAASAVIMLTHATD